MIFSDKKKTLRRRVLDLLKGGLTGVVLVAVLSGCTMMRPPSAKMPDRAGLRAGETVTVKANENIYSFAQKYNVSMREVIALNGLKPPFEIKTGDRLVLPVGGGSFAGEMKAPEAAPLSPVEKSNLAPVSPAPVSSQSLDAPTSASSAAPQAKALVVDPFSHPVPQQKPTASTAESLPPSVVSSENPSSDKVGRMKWPVKGPILSSFGVKGPGLSNDGVNIGAPRGAPVVASAAGTVAYAGNDMKGFGNLVLIRHQGDIVTAYAHLDRVLVKKDKAVNVGDMIGTVGKTGNVATPQLHFEIRRDGKPVDPTDIINSAS